MLKPRENKKPSALADGFPCKLQFLLLNDLNLHGIQTFLSFLNFKLHSVILANFIDQTALVNKDVFA